MGKIFPDAMIVAATVTRLLSPVDVLMFTVLMPSCSMVVRAFIAW